MARILKRSGHIITTCDSFPVFISSESASIKKSFICSSPRLHENAFVNDLNRIIDEQHIDWIIPTSEEIFYISKNKDRINANVFAEPISSLRILHHKYNFIECARTYGLPTPKTWIIHSNEDFLIWKRTEEQWNNSEMIIKPVYSRFGVNVRKIVPYAHDVFPAMNCSKTHPWVIQETITGTPICVYAIAHKGKLTVYADYTSSFFAGGACIYFQHKNDQAVLEWVKEFVHRYQFTGQISFDFIIQNRIPFPLECNPRTTSGLHLFSDHINFDDALFGNKPELITPSQTNSYMLGMAMWTYGLSNIHSFSKALEWMRIVLKAKDVVFQWNDPKPFVNQIKMFFWLQKVRKQKNTSLIEVITEDIKWDGD